MMNVHNLDPKAGYFCSMMDSIHSPEHIIITAGLSFKNIQEAFCGRFPFLKLEFFLPGTVEGQKPEPVSPDRKLKSFLNTEEPFTLELNEKMTVAELQGVLAEKLSAEPQVYRKAGSVWVEILLTDHWTLGLQNEEGRHLSSSL